MNIKEILEKANCDPGNYASCKVIGQDAIIEGVVNTDEVTNRQEKILCYVPQESLKTFSPNELVCIGFEEELNIADTNAIIIDSCSSSPMFGWDHHIHIKIKK